MNNKVEIKAQYKIEGISMYKDGERKWDNSGLSCIFEVKNGTGKINISTKDISIDEVKGKKNDIETALEDFLLFLIFSSNEPSLAYTEKSLKLLHSSSSYQILSDSDIERAVKMINGEHVENTSELALPCLFMTGEINVQQVDLPEFSSFDIAFNDNLRRNLFTFIQTAALRELSENYLDDMLKRWFLILDEIETDQGNAEFARIMNARDFVSHYFCDRKKVLKLITKELPNAICTEREKDVARFDRQNNEHIEFIKQYEILAKTRVRRILEQKLGLL